MRHPFGQVWNKTGGACATMFEICAVRCRAMGCDALGTKAARASTGRWTCQGPTNPVGRCYSRWMKRFLVNEEKEHL